MTRRPLHLDQFVRFGAIFAFALLIVAAPGISAQTPEADLGDGPHPAHIHAGTCETLGEVVVPLDDVLAAESSGEVVGAATAHPVQTSRNVIDMPLDELLAGEYAINIHQSAEAIDVYIACGAIGGTLTTDDDGERHLIFGLGELNDSGHTGIVWLGDDGDQTEVVISLIEPEEMD